MNAYAFGQLSDSQQRSVLAMMPVAAKVQLYRNLRSLQASGLAGDDLGSWLSSALKNVKGALGPIAAGLTSFIPGVGPVLAPLVATALTPAPQTSPTPAPQAAPVAVQRSGIDQTTMMLMIGVAALVLLAK